MNHEVEQKKISETPTVEEVEFRQESYFLCGSPDDNTPEEPVEFQ